MVVCKFFQQGYCRYGQNCRFEHIYGSKYSYHANPAPETQPQPQSDVTDEQLIHQVNTDVQSALQGGQWLLSSYAPFKEKANLPGLSDLSPEEARLLIYEAKSNNNVEQAVSLMNNLFKGTRHKYEQLLHPTPDIVKLLRSLYKGQGVSASFSNTIPNQSVFNANSGSAATSIFRSAVQNSPNTGFGQSTSVFAQSPDKAQSLFAQANQNAASALPQQIPNQNAMAGPDIFSRNPNASMFSQNASNVFASASHKFFGGAGDNKSSVFAANQSPSVFEINKPPSNVFTGSICQDSNNIDEDYYSNPEEVSPYDLEAFKGDTYILGFVPEIPPPRALT